MNWINVNDRLAVVRKQIEKFDSMLADSQDYSQKPLPKITQIAPLPTGKYKPEITDNWRKNDK